MSTFIVFTRESTQDQEALDTYMNLVAQPLKGIQLTCSRLTEHWKH